MNSKVWVGALLVALAIAAGCRSSTNGSQPSATTSSTGQAATDGRITKVVFIGQRKACDCTRKRIDATRKALDEALASHPGLELTELELDIDEQAVDRYEQMRALMTAPGVYYLNAGGKLVEMLQGELTAAQLERPLSRAAAGNQGG